MSLPDAMRAMARARAGAGRAVLRDGGADAARVRRQPVRSARQPGERDARAVQAQAADPRDLRARPHQRLGAVAAAAGAGRRSLPAVAERSCACCGKIRSACAWCSSRVVAADHRAPSSSPASCEIEYLAMDPPTAASRRRHLPGRRRRHGVGGLAAHRSADCVQRRLRTLAGVPVDGRRAGVRRWTDDADAAGAGALRSLRAEVAEGDGRASNALMASAGYPGREPAIIFGVAQIVLPVVVFLLVAVSWLGHAAVGRSRSWRAAIWLLRAHAVAGARDRGPARRDPERPARRAST